MKFLNYQRKLKLMLLLPVILNMVACISTAEEEVSEKKREKQVATNIQLGVEYMNRKKWEYAKERLEAALELDSDHSEANNAMGLLMWKLKEMDKAETYLTKAADLAPKDANAQNNLGVFLCQQGKLDDAVERFKMAIDNPLYVTPAQANLNAGMCLMKRHDTRKAVKYFREALKENPKLAGALSEMAKISYENKKYLRARAFLQRYFEVGKDKPDILLVAVKTERKLGGKDAEASYKIRLIGKFPDSKEAGSIRKR